MTNHWIPYREKQGIAKYNFIGHAPTSPKLTLTVGQKVTLLARSTDGQWYYGETVYRFGIETVTRNPNNPPVDRRGIFPCSYIHDLRKSDSKEMSIVDEITCVLREWHMLWKTLYLRNRTEFNSLSKKMEELIDLRGKIVSQKLPLDELKSVKSSASTTMDVGNKTLGLDLVVRDEHSNLLKPKDVSTPNMYKMHEEANERIRVSLKANSRPISSVSDTYHSMCHSIGVTVKRWKDCGIVEPPHLQCLFALYDGTANKVFSEALVVRKAAPVTSPSSPTSTKKMSRTSAILSSTSPLNTLSPLVSTISRGGIRVLPALPSSSSQPRALPALPSEGQSSSQRPSLSQSSSQRPSPSQNGHPILQSQLSVNSAMGYHRVLFTDLNSEDANREKVFLVCYVVRIGPLKDTSLTDSNQSQSSGSGTSDVRRAYGVAVLDITAMLKSSRNNDEDQFMSFLACDNNKDNLDNTLKKLIFSLPARQFSGPGVFVGLTFHTGNCHGDTISSLRTNTLVARKMGFPEIILPADVRNDLYVTLVSGDFTSGKNIQVTVQVCNTSGKVLEDVVRIGVGVDAQNRYDSLVYYHEDKPRWCETFKLAIDIDEFKASHLKITYRHRSSSETKTKENPFGLKNKSDKPFGLSFIKLMQKNGTTLPDTMHELLVYKIDHKKFDVNYTNYLSLPSTRSERDEIGLKTLPHLPGLSLFLKDFLVIETNVCSTKLTQNVDLLGFLNWHSDTTRLDVSLCNLMNLGGEEIVKFLQDILDTLFQILIENNNNAMIDHLVFDCLLHIIHLVVQNAKYQNFQAVLDLYLKENFSATLVYTKLISILSRHIAEGSTCNLAGKSKKGSPYSLKDTLLNSMKCIKYLMKIIIQSRHLFANLDNGAGEADFRNQIRELLFGIGKLISTASTQSTEILIVQGACLKYLPGIFPELLQVFDPLTLSKIIIEIIESPAAVQRLSRQRMMTLSALVDSQLFVIPESRRVLLPFILNSVRQFLDTNRLEEELCTSVLSDIMSFLWKTPTVEDIQDVTLIVLRTVVQNIFGRDCAKEQLGHLVAIMLSIFRHMSSRHYEVYISHLATNSDKSNFLTEILLVFKDLIERPVYPNDWLVMIRLQNEIMFKALKFFSDTVVEHFTRPFEYTAWSNWFHCMCVFLTQPSLQLELFSLEKRTKLLRDTPHSDMRIDAAQEIKRMWDILGENRSFFIPNQVGMFLQASLIPETEVRDILIPIFFDMMVCEFHSSPDQARNFIKGDFSEFENEMIVKLDALIEGGLGDSSYQSHFERILSPLCEKHSTLRDPGGSFVKSAAQQIDALLEYRSLVQDTNPDIRVRCTVRLLDFYAKTPRKELYLRYVHKLVALHLATEDYTEAAFTLELHAKLLSWNNEPIHPSYKLDRFPDLNTQRELKEALYEEAIVYFNKGKMWESALTLCKELFQVYDTEVFDYRKVELTLTKMPNLYEKIREKNRQELEYFRVGYYGRGFPTFLQNQVFIYRGKEYERLVDFTTRILNFYPHAELIKKLTPPDENITESCGQYFQINKVEPIMCTDIERKFSDKPICSEKIVAYFRWNGVQRFQYSCRVECPELNIPGLNRRSSSSEGSTMNRLSIISSGSQSGNEFATQWYQRHILSIKSPLPGIVRWFPVKSTKTVFISPINRAIETMDQANRNLKDLIMQVKNSKNEPNLKGGPFSTLLMTLKGIIAAEVNGGISNYETAFLHPSYLISNPDDAMFVSKLKDLIASQIPLLEVGLTLHAQRMESDMRPLHEHLESTFLAMKHSVEAKYGRKTCDISVDKLFLPPPPVYNAPATPTQDRGWSSLGFGTLNRPSKKKKNRERNKTLDTNSPSSSQWYDVARSANRNKTHSVITLSQELTPTRPLRSEVKRVNRLSQECVSLYSMDSEDADDCVTPTAATPPVIPEKRKENGELFSRENYDISISENVEQLIDGNEPIVDGHLHGHAEQSSAGNEDRLTVGKLDELLEKRCSRGNESLNSNSTVYSNSTVGSHSTLNPDSTNSSGNRSSTISSENQLSNTTSSENPLSSTTSSENPLSSTTSIEKPLSNSTSSETSLYNKTSSENQLSNKTSSENQLLNNTSSQNLLFGNNTSSENPMLNNTASETPLLNNTSSKTPLSSNISSDNNSSSTISRESHIFRETPPSTSSTNENLALSAIARISIGHGPDTIDHGTDGIDHGPDTIDHGPDTIDHGTDTIDHGTDTIDHRPDTIAHGSDTITDHGTDSMIEPPKPKIPLKKKESGTNLLGIPGNEPADHHEPNGKDGFSTHNYDPVRIYPTVMYPGSPRITIQPSKPPPPDPGHPDYSSPGQDDDRAPTPPPVPPKSPKKGRSKSVPFGPSPDQQLEDYKSPPQPQPVRHAPSSKPVPQTPPESPLPVRWTQPVSDGLLHESPVPLRWPKVPPTATESPTPPARGIPPVRERRSSPGYVSSAQELLTSSVHPNYESVFPIKSCQTPPVHSNYDSVSPIHCRTPPVYSNYDSVSPINPRDPIGPWKTPYDIKQPEDLNRDHEYRGLNASLIAPPKPPLGKRQPLPSPAEEAVEEERNPIKYTHQEQVHRSTSLPLEAHHQDQTVAPTSECGIHAPPVYSNYNTIPLPLRIPQDTHQGPILPLKHRDVKHTPDRDVKHTPDRDVKHTPDRDVKHTPDRDVKHTPDRDVKHTPDRDVKHTPDQGVKHTPDRDVKQTPNQMYIKPEDLQIRLKSTPPPIPPHVFRRYSSSPNIEVRSSRGGGEDERPPTPPPKQPHIKSPLAMSVNRRQSPPDPPHP